MKKATFALLLVGLFSVSGAYAQKKKALVDDVSGQGYGMAGCGLGSIVFGEKPGMIQIVAATVNGTGLQTVAITFGTSNCGEGGKMAKVEQFIEVNKMALEKDVVRGQGETVSSLSQLMSCKNSNFSNEMSANYRRAFPQGNANAEGLSKVATASCEL